MEENITQCQGQAELGLISSADGRVFHRLPNDFYCYQFMLIYKVGLVSHVTCILQVKRWVSSTEKYIRRIIVTLQEPDRIVIRLGNEVLVITGDRPDGEAADWVNIEDIATEQHKNIPPDSVQSGFHI